MGQIPPKYFTQPAPYGSSQAANVVNPVQQAAQNPQTPLLPPNFTDPGKAITSTLSKPQPGVFGGGGYRSPLGGRLNNL